MKEYAYKKSMALGGEDGILLFSVKINKPCVEHPQADITLEVLGEAGQNKAVFSSTDFVDALEAYVKILKNDMQSNLASIRVEEKAMMVQAELLDPEKIKQKFMAEYMLKMANKAQEKKDDIGIVNGSDGGRGNGSGSVAE